MALNLVTLPYQYYPDFTTGRPVYFGSIYVGDPDTDPEFNQKTVTLRHEGGDTAVSQPITTSAGGVPQYNGSPAQILTDGNYSIKVLNQALAQVYYVANALNGAPLVDGEAARPLVTTVDMVADTSTYVVGDYVQTPGYTTDNDGGGNDFRVQAVTGGAANPGSLLKGVGNPAIEFVGLFPKGIIKTSQFGVAGSDSTADRIATQAAVDYLSSGDTLIIDVDSTLENATGSGATPVLQRADAVANNTLYAINSALDNITIHITAVVTATSLLDDLFRFTGAKVLVKGPGNVIGSGSTLDTNSQDPLLQWRPSLVKVSGAGSICNKVKFTDPHTISLYLAGSELGASQNYFEGGLAVHGSGTIFFGIENGVSSLGHRGNIIVNNTFADSASGKNVYSGILGTASQSVMMGNVIDSTLEHGIYDNGSYNKISSNSISNNTTAAAIQSFGNSGMIITENTITDCDSGGISLQRGLKSVVSNNVLNNVGLSGIAWRKADTDANTANYTDISIENNVINHTGTQSAIDFALECNAYRININNNQVFSTGTDVTYGPVRIQVTAAASEGGFSLNFNNNTIYGSLIYGGYFDNFTNFNIKGNTWEAVNQTLSDTAVRMFNMTKGKFKDNTAIDGRGTKLTSRIIFASSGDGNTDINISDNTGDGLLVAANAIVSGPDLDGRYRGNCTDYDTAFGTFTVLAAASTVVSNSTMRASGGNQVILTPVNKAAVDIQNSVQALYVSATADGTFTATTSDGTALGAAVATYSYGIIQ